MVNAMGFSASAFRRAVSGSVTVSAALLLAALAGVWSVRDRVFGPRDGAPEGAGPQAVGMTIAGQKLAVPSHLIRFEDQRSTGTHGRVDLAFTWPDLAAVQARSVRNLDDATPDPAVVFVSIEPRQSPLDTSARLTAVYARFFVGAPIEGPNGLVGQRMASGSGYEDELIFYEPGGVRPFAARCFATDGDNLATTCLREIAVGPSLVALYRFRYALMPDWRSLDERVRTLAEGLLTR